MRKRQFYSKINFMIVDECHYVEIWGLTDGPRVPFRPAWGDIGRFRTRLGVQVPLLGLSATVNSQSLARIQESLHINATNSTVLRLSLNRPNLTYAVLPLPFSTTPWTALDFLIPLSQSPETIARILRKTIIFFDDCLATSSAVTYLRARLPAALQDTKLIAEYHSQMSQEYLAQTMKEFRDGVVLIMCCTSSASNVRMSVFTCSFGSHELGSRHTRYL